MHRVTALRENGNKLCHNKLCAKEESLAHCKVEVDSQAPLENPIGSNPVHKLLVSTSGSNWASRYLPTTVNKALWELSLYLRITSSVTLIFIRMWSQLSRNLCFLQKKIDVQEDKSIENIEKMECTNWGLERAELVTDGRLKQTEGDKVRLELSLFMYFLMSYLSSWWPSVLRFSIFALHNQENMVQ